MKPLSIIGLAFATAAAGTWAKSNNIGTRQIVGGAFLLVVFAVLQDSQPRISKDFAWLILAATVGSYGPDLFESVGKVVNDGGKKATGQPATPPVTSNGHGSTGHF